MNARPTSRTKRAIGRTFSKPRGGRRFLGRLYEAPSRITDPPFYPPDEYWEISFEEACAWFAETWEGAGDQSAGLDDVCASLKADGRSADLAMVEFMRTRERESVHRVQLNAFSDPAQDRSDRVQESVREVNRRSVALGLGPLFEIDNDTEADDVACYYAGFDYIRWTAAGDALRIAPRPRSRYERELPRDVSEAFEASDLPAPAGPPPTPAHEAVQPLRQVGSPDCGQLSPERSRKRRGKPGALLDLMAGRDRVSYADVAEIVHENPDITEDAIRQNVTRAKELALIERLRFTLSVADGYVKRVDLTE